MAAAREEESLLSSLGSDAGWKFHDEKWIHICNRFAYRQVLASGQQLNVPEESQPFSAAVTLSPAGGFSFRGKNDAGDRWLYMFLDPELNGWADFSWKFRICRRTSFREFQFGFRYRDFYNRYRYRFEAEHLYFDIVSNGAFFNGLGATPLRLEIGREYEIEIRAVDCCFECKVDGVRVSLDFDRQNRFSTGSIAIILWESGDRPDIVADLVMQSVRRLERRTTVETDRDI
jgi:hypothetical protein